MALNSFVGEEKDGEENKVITQWVKSWRASYGALMIVCSALVFVVYPARDVTITVHPGATHTWRGFGTPAIDNRWAFNYRDFSASGKEKFRRMLIDSCDVRFIRADWWSHETLSRQLHVTDSTAGLLLSRTKEHIDDLREICPDCIVWANPWPREDTTLWYSYDGNPEEWAAKVAIVAKSALDYGVRVDATGFCNEPDAEGWNWRDYPAIIKNLRRELDSRGLDYVKITAPDHSCTENNEIRRIQPILDDKEAINALGAYSWHSYTMCMLKHVRDSLRSSGINTFWVTEAGLATYVPMIPIENDTVELQAAYIGNVLADLNLGAEYNMLLRAGSYSHSEDQTQYMIDWTVMPDSTGDVIPLMRYFYAKQFCRAIGIDAQVRLCSSDLPGNYGTWMEAGFTYGGEQQWYRPHMYAAAAQNTDSTWGVALVNVTGSPTIYYKEWVTNAFHPAETLSVTVQVEELANEGDLNFAVYRTGRSGKDQPQGTVTMKNGKVVVTVAPSDLVTLKSVNAVRIQKSALRFRSGTEYRGQRSEGGMKIQTFGSSNRIAFTLPPQYDNTPVTLALHDIRGRLIQTVLNDVIKAGSHVIQWDEKLKLAHGVKIIRLFSSDKTLDERLLIDH